MKGDFSRQTFDPQKHYSSVLMQQGRVQVDADWNEQQDINQYRIETEAKDVIGKCGAPKHDAGFEITPQNDTLKIGKGRYYVNGILCQNETDVLYNNQPDLPNPIDIVDLLSDANTNIGLVYIDVWQRHITALDDPHIRETALGGPDTANRAKTVWQVKILPINPDLTSTCSSDLEAWNQLTKPKSGTLNARTQPSEDPNNPCLIPPTAGYQGLENQLYRVEIHHGSDHPQGPTFKWSRENGSVVTSIQKISSQEITVSDLGKDEVLGFANGQWLEISNDESELKGEPRELKLAVVNATTTTIDWGSSPAIADGSFPEGVDLSLHPKIRRWDQEDPNGVIEITFDWQPLEDGIEVQFTSGEPYKTGDYWLIPARTSTGNIEWPGNPQLPLGIYHYYCRLALVQVNDGILKIEDCRPIFPPLTELPTGKGGCCTLTVGKGGDFSDIQTAIDTVSQQEGEWVRLCILSGIYRLDRSIVIAKKTRLIISGCHHQTYLLGVFLLQDCSDIILESLWIEAESNQGAIKVNNGTRISITHCRIENHAEMSSLVIQSQAGKISDNYLNGLWIQEGSANILIQNNEITDGWGAGIALGGLYKGDNFIEGVAGVSQIEIQENYIHQMTNSGISTVAQKLRDGSGDVEDLVIVGNRIVQCAKESPQSFFNPLVVGGITLQNVSLVRIQDNTIAENGLEAELTACGIFINDGQGLEIANNTVINNGTRQTGQTCIDFTQMQSGSRPYPLIEQGVSFFVRDFQQNPVPQTEIDGGLNCGYSTEIQLPSPVSNISLLVRRFNTAPAEAIAYNSSGTIVDSSPIISDRPIVLTGTDIIRVVLDTDQNETFLSQFCFGSNAASTIQAGIFIVGNTSAPNTFAKLQTANTSLAAKIHNNTVICPRGQALILIGLGTMSILGNTLTSLGIGQQPQEIEQYTLLGKCVFIVNLGQDPLLSNPNLSAPANFPAVSFNRPPSAAVTVKRNLPDGRVLFHSNQVTFQEVEKTSQFVLSSVAILSADDISLQDNQILSEIDGGIPINDNLSVALLTNVFAFSASLRACGNRFNELLGRALLSYLSFGLVNLTTNNQATHCIFVNGNANIKEYNHEIVDLLVPRYCELVAGLFR